MRWVHWNTLSQTLMLKSFMYKNTWIYKCVNIERFFFYISKCIFPCFLIKAPGVIFFSLPGTPGGKIWPREPYLKHKFRVAKMNPSEIHVGKSSLCAAVMWYVDPTIHYTLLPPRKRLPGDEQCQFTPVFLSYKERTVTFHRILKCVRCISKGHLNVLNLLEKTCQSNPYTDI